MEAINLARELMLQLPDHATHRLQPLDVAIFKSLETYFDQEIMKWMHCNPVRKIDDDERWICEVCEKAETLSNVGNGFRATGIRSVDSMIFSDSDFIVNEDLNPSHFPLEFENDRENNLTNVSNADEDT